MMALIMFPSTLIVAFFLFYITTELNIKARKESRLIRIEERKEDRQIQLEIQDRIDKRHNELMERFRQDSIDAQKRHEAFMKYLVDKLG